MLYTIFDTETSGLESDCDILSFSYMLTDEFMHSRRSETLYFWKEGVTKWSQEAFEINGLSKDFLRQYEKDYDANLRKMFIYLHQAFVVGYNSGWVSGDGVIRGFDFQRCTAFLSRNNIPEPAPCSFIDIMKVGETVYGRRFKLQTLFDKLNLSRSMADIYNMALFNNNDGAHSSSYDTICTAMIFKHMHETGVLSGESHSNNVEEDVKWFIRFKDTGMFDVLRVEDGTEEVFTVADMARDHKDILNFLLENPNAHLAPTGEEGFVDV